MGSSWKLLSKNDNLTVYAGESVICLLVKVGIPRKSLYCILEQSFERNNLFSGTQMIAKII